MPETRARKEEDWPDAGSRGSKMLKMWGARSIQEMGEQIKPTAQLKTQPSGLGLGQPWSRDLPGQQQDTDLCNGFI